MRINPADLVSLSRLVEVMPEIRTRLGTIPSRNTIHKWASIGIRGIVLPTITLPGNKIKLTTIKLAAGWLERIRPSDNPDRHGDER